MIKIIRITILAAIIILALFSCYKLFSLSDRDFRISAQECGQMGFIDNYLAKIYLEENYSNCNVLDDQEKERWPRYDFMEREHIFVKEDLVDCEVYIDNSTCPKCLQVKCRKNNEDRPILIILNNKTIFKKEEDEELNKKEEKIINDTIGRFGSDGLLWNAINTKGKKEEIRIIKTVEEININDFERIDSSYINDKTIREKITDLWGKEILIYAEKECSFNKLLISSGANKEYDFMKARIFQINLWNEKEPSFIMKIRHILFNDKDMPTNDDIVMYKGIIFRGPYGMNAQTHWKVILEKEKAK